MTPTLFCFQLPPQTLAAVRRAALPLKLRVREGDPASGEALSVLCGITAPRQAPAIEPISDELLLFAGLNDRQLDAFLTRYRAGGAPRILLKAVLTPTNAGWTLPELVGELIRESTALKIPSSFDTNAR